MVTFFFQAEDGIRDVRTWLEFRRVLFRLLMCFVSLSTVGALPMSVMIIFVKIWRQLVLELARLKNMCLAHTESIVPWSLHQDYITADWRFGAISCTVLSDPSVTTALHKQSCVAKVIWRVISPEFFSNANRRYNESSNTTPMRLQWRWEPWYSHSLIHSCW